MDKEITKMSDLLLEPYPVCPICEKRCENYYTNKYGDILGCENCVMVEDAYKLEY